MRSLSNLYKKGSDSGYYTRVIDNNELLEQKLTALSYEQEKKAREELRRAALEAKGIDPDTPEDELPPEFKEGIIPGEEPETSQEMQIDYVEAAKSEAEQIVRDATNEAQQILTKAAEEAENLREEARRQATEQGYGDGMAKAEQEAGRMRQELDRQRTAQDEAYQNRLQQMEPELMEIVTNVFDRVFHTAFFQKKEILLYLIQHTVQNIKDSHEYRIRVSVPDHEFVTQHRDEIIQKVGGDITLDIVLDESLGQGQCTIDTDEGVFDCSIDVELENLLTDLRMLSAAE